MKSEKDDMGRGVNLLHLRVEEGGQLDKDMGQWFAMVCKHSNERS